MEIVENIERIAVKRKTAAQMLDCGETTIWRLCKEGKLETIKIFNDQRITIASIKRLGKVA